MPLDLPTGQAFVAESKSVRQFINKEGDTMETTKIRLAFDNMLSSFAAIICMMVAKIIRAILSLFNPVKQSFICKS